MLKLFHQTSQNVLRLWGLEKGIVKQGMVCIIHTFGYDIKWNPHVHLIVTEGGLTSGNVWKYWPWNRKKHKHPYISFPFLQSKWRELFSAALFSSLEKCWDDNADLRDYIYKTVLSLKKNAQKLEKEKFSKERKRITLRNKPS